MKTETLKTYAVLAGVVALATVVGALATSWMSVALVTVAAALGVMLAGRVGSLSVIGVAAVVAIITILVPSVLAWWAITEIAESGVEATVVSGPGLELAWAVLVPILVAVITLRGRSIT